MHHRYALQLATLVFIVILVAALSLSVIRIIPWWSFWIVAAVGFAFAALLKGKN